MCRPIARPWFVFSFLLLALAPLHAARAQTDPDSSVVPPPDSTAVPPPDSTKSLADTALAAVPSARTSSGIPLTGLFGAFSDSLRLRVEIGASTDVTNEQFYEETFLDSITAGGRRLVSTPEARTAGVLFATLVGTRDGGAVSYQVQNLLSLGDLVRQAQTSLTWRHDLGHEWRYVLIPRLEYRRDRTFDRDLEEARAGLAGRLRRAFDDGGLLAEVAASGEWLESSGLASDLLLDRRVSQFAATLDRLPIVGSEWRLEYRVASRIFPDSASRDHWEYAGQGRWMHPFAAGHRIGIESNLERRQTHRIVPTSRDNFWSGGGTLEGEVRLADARALAARVGIDFMHYDLEDEVLCFDYRILRARLGPKFERGGWSLSVGPRGEILRAPRNVVEQYREVGGAAEVEYLGSEAWWSVSPSAGWRDYDDSDAEDAGIHSSFAFYELGVLADRSLAGAVRLRLFANGRYESHVDHAQDARSLYFSLDVRRLF